MNELRKGLIRVINKEMNKNYLININQKNNFYKNNRLINIVIKESKKVDLTFKSINQNAIYVLPINESGNYFDFILFDEYFLE